MSAINVLGDEEVYGEVVEGWFLVRLVRPAKEHRNQSNFQLSKNVCMFWGDWGLTDRNDPVFIFRFDPLPKTSQSKHYPQRFHHYLERLCGDVEKCHNLMEACLKAGYNPKKCRLAVWLMDRMYQHLKSLDWKPKYTH